MAQVLHLTGPVLVGPEEVRDEAWVVGGRVTYTRPTGDHDVTHPRRVGACPGLVDAHCHVGLGPHGAVPPTDGRAAGARRPRDGTLLIRDAGSPADTRWIDDREDLPRVIRAGRHIARTRRYIRNYAWEVEPEQLVEQVRTEARAGDGWVKLVGDWIDREVGDLTPCWPRDVLAEAVAAAHEEGARVTAHCFGEESLRDFAAAGTDCIEHACGLEDDTVATFAEQGIAIVPTLVNIDTFPAIAEPAREKFPEYHRHMLDLHARRYDTIRTAHEAGIPVYVGTDAGGSLAHGLAAQEVERLTRCGFTPLEALDAGTWAARSWLGRTALEEGAEADLLVLAQDPRADIGTLTAPRAIVLGGALVG